MAATNRAARRAERAGQTAPPPARDRDPRSRRQTEQDDDPYDEDEDDDLDDDPDDDEEDDQDDDEPEGKSVTARSHRTDTSDRDRRDRRRADAQPTETRVSVRNLMKAIGDEFDRGFKFQLRPVLEELASLRHANEEMRKEIDTLRKAVDDTGEAADEAVGRADEILKAFEPIQAGMSMVKALSERVEQQVRKTPEQPNTAVSGTQDAADQTLTKGAVNSPGVKPTAEEALKPSAEVEGLLQKANNLMAEWDIEVTAYPEVVAACQNGTLTKALVDSLRDQVDAGDRQLKAMAA